MNRDPVAAALELFEPRFPYCEADWEDVLRRAEASTNGRVHFAPAPVKRHGRLRPKVVAVVPVLAIAVALVVAWPFAAAPAVLANAIAAVGTGPLEHVVLANDHASLVDLRTGTRVPVSARTEIWFDPAHGSIIRTSFRGRQTGRFYVPNNRGRSAALYMQTFTRGYQSALRSHAFRVTGSGTLFGHRIYWIESNPNWVSGPQAGISEDVQQIAISRTTYKPIFERTLRDGRPVASSAARVLVIETTAPKPALFTNLPLNSPPDWGPMPTSPQLTLTAALTSMSPRPLLPRAIGLLRRSWVGLPPYLRNCCGSKTEQVPGVSVYYGKLSTNSNSIGQPSYTGRYIAVTEFPRRNNVTDRIGLGSFPNAGKAVLDEGSVSSDHSATFAAHGLYFIVRASSDADALAAAKTLAGP